MKRKLWKGKKLSLKQWRLKALRKLGNRCQCCDERYLEFLTFDHMNGNGYQHRKQFSGAYYYKWICTNIDAPSILQILCMNCNWSKRISKVCPHKADPALVRKIQRKKVKENEQIQEDDDDERLLSEIEKSHLRQVIVEPWKSPPPTGFKWVRHVGQLVDDDFFSQNDAITQQTVPDSANA